MLPQTFIFIGRSGCGKGTQAELLTQYLKKNFSEFPVFYLETGERFRQFIQQDNYTSQLSEKLYKEITPQPIFLTVWMWSHLLVENLTGREHLIIDGTPRAYAEALALSSAMKFYDRKPTVIYINVSRKWAEERLQERGRSDDVALESIKKRLDWFDQSILPAVEYYRSSPECRFLEISGERSIDDIHTDIVEKIK